MLAGRLARDSLLPGRLPEFRHSFPAVSTGRGFEIVVTPLFHLLLGGQRRVYRAEFLQFALRPSLWPLPLHAPKRPTLRSQSGRLATDVS
jgi:hypothetical protein